MDIEKQYNQVSADLKKVDDQLKSYAEQSEKAIKAHKDLSEGTKGEVDKLLSAQSEMQEAIKNMEQAMADGKTSTREAFQSLGNRLVNSEDFEANAQRLMHGKGSFSFQGAITEDPASGGDLIDPQRVPGIVKPGERKLTIRDLLTAGTTNSNSVEFVQETGFTNSADVVSENPTAGKPESDLTFDLLNAPVATIAHWIHASKQVLDDAAMLQSYIDGRLRHGLKLKEEQQLLLGSGTGLNINGLYTQATAYTPGLVDVTNDSTIDRLRLALLQVTLAEYDADGIVLNPTDWAGIELTKDTQGRYIFGNPQQGAQPRLWGKPVVETQAMTADNFLVGAFQMGAQLWDREQVNVEVSTEDRDNFIKNMVTIRCEERLALTVYRPESFVKGDFTIGSGGA